MISVTLYARPDCHLCKQVKDDLDELKATIPHELKIVNIDDDPELQRKYAIEIPVVAVEPFILKSPFTFQELKVTLLAARDRARHIEMVEASPKLQELREYGVWTKADAISRFFSRHYMLVFNFVVVLYLAGAFLAPILMKLGYRLPANLLYRGYSLVCHQLGYRSFYIFGEQVVYPRAAAHVPNVLTFNQATGLSEGFSANDLLAARGFVGNDSVGYKVALCERDIAIYFGILLFGLLFSISRYRIPPFPWYLWLSMGILPIGIDGLSQLLSQPPLSFLPYRESTPILRVLTGSIFGFTTAWFGYPVVEETMQDMRASYETKWKRTRMVMDSIERPGSGNPR
jgi:uncharacterized membrane protein